MKHRNRPSSPGNLLLAGLMLPLSFVVAFPFYYILVTTMKTPAEIQRNPLGLPQEPILTNYAEVLQNPLLYTAFWNTLFLTIGSVVLMLLVGSLAAFAATIRRQWISRAISIALLVAFLVPFQTTLLPLYRLIVGFGLVDTLTGLIAVYSGGAVFCYFVIIGYMRTIPMEIFEAARIDGAGPVRMYFSVALPLIRPVLITVGVFQTMWVWNDYLAPIVFLSSPEKSTLVLLAARAVSQFTVNWPMFMTVTVVVLVPILIFFIFAQRYIVSGLISGGVKG
jgi:raffinose/stachyose/melibiose transport system permease protein